MTQIQGDIDTTYTTHQRDMFTSGLAAEIGASAFMTWNAIKWHADFNTGESYPGIRRIAEITGMSTPTVVTSIKVLEANLLLRISGKRGQQNVYIARERLDVRVGKRVICTVVVDFIPAQMRERLQLLQKASSGSLDAEDVWAQVDLIPGPGMTLDAKKGTFSGTMRADEVPDQIPMQPTMPMGSVKDAKAALKRIADEMRTVPKK